MGDSKVSEKGKSSKEMVNPEADCSLPSGMWDPGFNLSHKIDFNFDLAEQKVMAKTTK